MPEVGQDAAPAGLDARYEQLRHAVLHERARAFPLGLGVLIAKGVTAWRRLLTHLAGTTTTAVASSLTRTPSQPVPAAQAPAPLPDAVAAQLVHVLAGLAVALTGS